MTALPAADPRTPRRPFNRRRTSRASSQCPVKANRHGEFLKPNNARVTPFHGGCKPGVPSDVSRGEVRRVREIHRAGTDAQIPAVGIQPAGGGSELPGSETLRGLRVVDLRDRGTRARSCPNRRTAEARSARSGVHSRGNPDDPFGRLLSSAPAGFNIRAIFKCPRAPESFFDVDLAYFSEFIRAEFIRTCLRLWARF